MLFENISIIDENIEVKHGMYVAVENDMIAYIGSEKPEKDFGECYDGKNKLLMSAFYNAHGHSPMSLMRGYGENMALQDWLTKRIFPFEDQLDANAVYWSTLLTQAESMKYGIVSTSDMYYFIDDMEKAVCDAGMKANISRAIVHFGDSDPWEMPSMQEMSRTMKAYNGAENGRIIMDGSIHAEYTISEKAAREVIEFTRENNALLHIHLSETKTEHEECKGRRGGKTPAQFFDSIGAFDGPALVAHAVWLESEDFDIIEKKGVSVASNPCSNMKLASGICNVPELLRRGVNVAIGTDSVASNNSLNFFEEMKFFALGSKVAQMDPTLISPKETIYCATRGGALAQGRKDCGLVKEGFKADLIVVDLLRPNMYPIHNLLNNMVYSAGGDEIVLTMCDGKVIYRDGNFLTLDLERAIFETEKAKDIILAKLV